MACFFELLACVDNAPPIANAKAAALNIIFTFFIPFFRNFQICSKVEKNDTTILFFIDADNLI